MDEEIKSGKTKKEDKVAKTVVVEQLPTQQVNTAVDEKGTEITLVTMADALTEILEKVRKLEKALT